MHPEIVPVLFAPDRQEQAERKLVVLGCCGLESGSEPRNIGRPQQSEAVRFMHVQYRALLLTRTAPVGYYDGTGRNVILKLHIAAAGDKEIQLFLDIIQLALGAVAVRYSALLQQLGRQALGVTAEHLIGGKRRQCTPEAHADLLQAVEQHRVERAALSVEDHGDGGVVGVCLFVAAVTGQRVKYVRQCDYLRRDRDLFTEQAVRIAAAVPAFVVPAADLDGDLDQRLVAVLRQPLEHGCADDGMGADDVEFLGRQCARLVQNVLGDADLADVVQGGRGGDEADLVLGQTVYIGLFGQLAQQHFGHGLHLKHMLCALAVAELDDMTEDADHDMAVLLVLIDLVGDHAHQPLLVGVERERVFDAALHDEGVERTADIVGNAEAVTALDNRTVLGGGDHDDWQLLDPAELIQALEHAEAVDFRHIDIQQQQVDIHILLEHEDGLRTVLCLRVIIFLAEDCLEHFSVEFRVVNNQNFLSVHSRSTAAGSPSLPLFTGI